MRKYFFLSSDSARPPVNPGNNFISSGIKYLVSRADPYSISQDITLYEYRKSDWEIILSQASAVFLCGNPRFDPSDTPFFWLTKLLNYMHEAQSQGIKIGDLFLGSAFPLPLMTVPEMCEQLLVITRNKNTCTSLANFDLVITRDTLSQEICSRIFNHSVLLPDSAFWAARYYKIEPGEKHYNCVTVPSLNCHPWLIKKLYEFSLQLSKERPTFVLAHCLNEYRLVRETLPDIKNLLIIYDPAALLRFYSFTDKLVSCRLHGSVPALSLGASVCNISMDSRAMAYDQFGFESVPFSSLNVKDPVLRFDKLQVGNTPAPAPFINLFKKKFIR